MKAILLENILHKGQRYKAGAVLDLDAVTAAQFRRAGIAHVEDAPKPPAPKPPAPKPPAIAPDLPSAARKQGRTGKKASTSKKSTRGQK